MHNLSPFVIRKLALAFYRFDLTKDGLVRDDDFQTYGAQVAEHLGIAKGTAQHTKVHDAYMNIWNSYFKHADADNNGSVTLVEYISACAKFMSGANAHEQAKSINAVLFDTLDLDGSGYITPSELAVFLKPMGVSERDAYLAFGYLDRERTGKISREVFAANLADYYMSSDQTVVGNWFYGP